MSYDNLNALKKLILSDSVNVAIIISSKIFIHFPKKLVKLHLSFIKEKIRDCWILAVSLIEFTLLRLI